ncbi:MAG: hypothetical protein KC657_12775 [Myxococcales bacterium]|nr:hypothetical protein [Myxococcales bacterium]
MIKRTASVLGISLSLMACAVAPAPAAELDDGPSGAARPSALVDALGGTDDATAPTEGADAIDVGSSFRMQFPSGRVYAYASTGDTCAWTVNGTAKGTSTVLDMALLVGTYEVACRRADGVSASKSVSITASTTTTAVMTFPLPDGTLLMAASGGTCWFYVNGAPKGGATSSLQLSLKPGAYTASCKPTSGAATVSKSVLVHSGATSMAMFKL